MSKDRMHGILKMLERLPVPVVIASPLTGKILWVNALLVKMAGGSDPGQLVGGSLLDFVQAPQQGIALRDLAKVAIGQSPPSVVYELKRLDGAFAAGHVSSIPMMYFNQPAMLSLVTDVSERERLIRDLADSEERYRSLIESTPSGIVVVAGEAIVYANRALSDALGLAGPEELLGGSIYDYIAPELRKPVREARRQVLLSGVAYPAAPVVLVRADGSLVPTTAATTRIQWHGELATQTLMHRFGTD